MAMDEVQAALKVLAFAREVERRLPRDVTTTWWRKERDPAHVFLDYNQNARDHTIAAAYSVRGTPRATVSAPRMVAASRHSFFRPSMAGVTISTISGIPW